MIGLRLLIVCALLGALTPAWAQDGSYLDEPIQVEVAPRSEVRGDSLIVLSNGGVVRGSVNYLTGGTLYFDSEKIDDDEFDWEDVSALRSQQRFVIQLATEEPEGEKLRGRIRVDEDSVAILTEAGEQILRPRAALLSLYPFHEDSEWSKWEGKFSLQLSASVGNTENATGTATLTALRIDGDWSFRFEGQIAQGRSQEEEFTKSRWGLTQLNYDLNQRVFLVLAFGTARYDKFQNLAVQLRAGSGVGLRFVREPDVRWWVEAGPAYIYTRYRRVEPTEDQAIDSPALRLATRLWTEILNDDFSLSGLYEVYLGLADIQDTTHTLRLELSYEFIKDWTFDFSLTYNRSERTQRDTEGVLPKRDDFLFGLGLGIKF